MNLTAIREARTAKTVEARAIVSAAESGKRNLTADESARFDALKAEITDLDEQEARAQFLADAERRAQGEPVIGSGDQSFDQLEQRVSLMRILQAGMENRSLDGAELEYNRELTRRNGRPAKGFYLPMRALEQRVNTTGTAGQLVGTDHRGDQYIEPLRNALLARRLGVRVLSGLRGDVSIPKAGNSTVAGWVAENSALSPSDMTFGSVGLDPKHVGALSEMSRQLIQQSDPSIEALLRDDLAFGIAKAIDSALIGGGGANEPDGIIATLGTANGTLGTPTWDEALAIVDQVESGNALSPSHNWIMRSGAKAKLASTLKVSGDAGAGFILEGGRMADFPVYSTNQMGSDSNGNDVIFGDWSQVLLGIWSELDILVNPFAETAYSKGNVLVRAMATCDIGIRHIESFVWADDVPGI
ncbi:phage major capsid protein [Dokdonella sp.]|uniref:phage major capsid protein n=1 Tax=Dokdonella sp. TaxID=2291710 RepID=UPI00352901D9